MRIFLRSLNLLNHFEKVAQWIITTSFDFHFKDKRLSLIHCLHDLVLLHNTLNWIYSIIHRAISRSKTLLPQFMSCWDIIRLDSLDRLVFLWDSVIMSLVDLISSALTRCRTWLLSHSFWNLDWVRSIIWLFLFNERSAKQLAHLLILSFLGFFELLKSQFFILIWFSTLSLHSLWWLQSA